MSASLVPSSILLFGVVLSAASIASAQGGPAQKTVTVCGESLPTDATDARIYLNDESTSPCSGIGLGALKGLPNLERLELTGSGVTTGALKTLSAVPTIETLVVNHSQINNGGLRHLAALPRLESLDLSFNADLTGASIAHLKSAPALRAIVLAKGQVTNIGVAHLSAIASLSSVETEYDSDAPRPGCGKLRQCFDVSGGTVDNGGLRHLAGRALTHLVVDPTIVDGDTLRTIRRIQGLQSLNCTHVSVRDSSGKIASHGVKGCFNLLGGAVGSELRQLEHLPVRHLLLDEAIPDTRFLASLDQLRSLNCYTCEEEEVCGGAAGLVGCKVRDLCIDLEDVLVSTNDFQFLTSFPRTEWLTVGPELSEAMAETIVKLRDLRALNSFDEGTFDLTRAKLDAGAFPLLLSHKSARRVLLSGAPVTNQQVEALVSAPNLRGLVLIETSVTSAQAARLLSNPALRELELNADALSSEVAALAAEHPSLRYLNTTVERCADECISSFPVCGTCDFGCFRDGPATCRALCDAADDELMVDLRGVPSAMKKLEVLARSNKRLRLAVDPTDASTVSFAATLARISSLNCPEAECLDFEGVTTKAVVRALSKRDDLESIVLAPKRIDDAVLAGIGRQRNLRSLNVALTEEGLILWGSSRITAKGLSHLRGLSRVPAIYMAPELIDDDVLRIIAALPGLRSINCPDASNYEDPQRCLNLTETKVSKASLGVLATVQASIFYVPWELVDDQVLSWITAAPNFDSLNCLAEDCSYPSGGAMPCPRRGCVAIAGTAVTVDGARRLAALPHLKTVIADEAIADELRKSFPSSVQVLGPEGLEHPFLGLP